MDAQGFHVILSRVILGKQELIAVFNFRIL